MTIQPGKPREDEVLGFTSYVQELVAWASQGSVQFGREIEQSTHWPTSIAWSTLGVDQQSRAVRLSAILKATFGSHGRIAVMIQSFQEGIDIVPGVTLGDPYSSSNLYLGNGFELLRQLSHEFSLRSRTEGLSLRVQLLNRVFQEQDSSDLIRQIELACAKYTRMISTLLGDSAGLAIALQQHVRERVFPDRKLRKRAPDLDIAAFDAACIDVRRLAAISEAEKPVSFAIGNSWNDTLRADKRHYLEYTQRSQI